jgi:hypothetical protein
MQHMLYLRTKESILDSSQRKNTLSNGGSIFFHRYDVSRETVGYRNTSKTGVCNDARRVRGTGKLMVPFPHAHGKSNSYESYNGCCPAPDRRRTRCRSSIARIIRSECYPVSGMTTNPSTEQAAGSPQRFLRSQANDTHSARIPHA